MMRLVRECESPEVEEALAQAEYFEIELRRRRRVGLLLGGLLCAVAFGWAVLQVLL